MNLIKRLDKVICSQKKRFKIIFLQAVAPLEDFSKNSHKLERNNVN